MIKMQNDYLNNRYYCDNNNNFLELRKLKIQSPHNCTKILSITNCQRTIQHQKRYKKYHPILLWINNVIQKYSLVQNISLNKKIYFILNDLIDFEPIIKRQRTYNILDLYPNYNGIDEEQIVLKKIIMEYPNKWSQLLTERQEYRKIYDYIINRTEKLNDSKYTLITKCYWIFNNITDFPKCKVDNKHILKNVRSFIHPCYDTCCKRCGQIFAGWERVTRNDYDYSQIKSVKKSPKYLQSIFESKDSNYKKQYFDIINKYKKTPIQFIKLEQCIDNPELYSEKHHINPRWYFNTNKIQIDNSDNNIIRVTYEDHVNLHFLLVKHYECINDTRNYYKALYACKAFYKRIHSTEKIYQLSNDVLAQLKLYKIQADAAFAKTHSGKNCHLFKWDKQTLEKMLIDFVKSNYDLNILKQKYNYTSSYDNFRALLRRNNISYQLRFDITRKNNKCLPTKEQYIEYKNIYDKYGFSSFQKKYNYPSEKRALMFLLKMCFNKYKI